MKTEHRSRDDRRQGHPFLARKKQELGVSLNPVQAEAALHTEGPLLLLASPGSGKTTTLMMRIGYLMEEKGVHPARIKAVTFSRASAADMKERFAALFPRLAPPEFSTIHSLAFEAARNYLHRTGTAYTLIEGRVEPEEETAEAGGSSGSGAGPAGPGELPLHKRIILRRLYAEAANGRITDDQLDELTTYISYIKNKMIPEERWADTPCAVPEAAGILRAYEAFKQSGERLLIDYDDMLTIGNRALDEDPELLRRFQRRYDYLLADESQDTSLIQHVFLEKLARPHRNLCLVADDDQSIYSWRGAEPSYLQRFGQLYPDARILFMEQNYRSDRRIVETAASFIARNRHRYPKTMFTDKAEGESVRITVLPSYAEQAPGLVERIRRLTGEKGFADAAVLYRNNDSAVALVNAFDRAGIPFRMKDTDSGFFRHWVVEDILNFMRFSFAPHRADLLERIHLRLNAYITRKQMAVLSEIPTPSGASVFDTLLEQVELADYQPKRIEECRRAFARMSGMPPREVIRLIRRGLGYEKALEQMCEKLGFRRETLIGILNTLEEIADTLESMEAFAARLKHLDRVMREARLRRTEAVLTLSTLHGAKGLEFDAVYMVDLTDGILPAPQDRRGTEEERELAMEESARLFYVGMTRARKRLELLTYRERDGETAAESPFLGALRPLPGVEASGPPVRSGQVGIGRDETGPDGGAVRTVRIGGSGGGYSRSISGTGAGAQRMSGSRTGGRADGSPRSASPGSGRAGRAQVVPPRAAGAGAPDAIRDRSALAKGAAVRHAKFGRGVIAAVEEDRLTIDFSGGEKKLLIAACLELGLLSPAGD
ncbi:ATP-dependent helicase [Paenibacillus spiritus]|uniref:DNA 3'-5' helicase n=1 Tax=Paenibacillus spiritus TaxID=2496557 RepID=A0A5J5GKC4_9BACL|nr:ATP-dependent helicase [Paenibacillus spiritus]KAA9008655.1 ATP-dependent helicase [Paenibacillus spiritus]